MFRFLDREIKNSDQAIKIFNSGKRDVWGFKGVTLLYDLGTYGHYNEKLGINLTAKQPFSPKDSEYDEGTHFAFTYSGIHYEVRVTKRVMEKYWSEGEEPYFHSQISLKANGERKLNAKVRQYELFDNWNILSISYLKTPLSWYHPLQQLFMTKNDLINQENAERLKRYNEKDLWED